MGPNATVATKVKAAKFSGDVFISVDRCKGCGFCIEFCPPKVLATSEKYNRHGYHPPLLVNQAGCTGCDLCGLYCPDFAIFGIRVPVAGGASASKAAEARGEEAAE